MSKRYCGFGKPTDCDGEMKTCPRCGDQVCEVHEDSCGFCLACQGEMDALKRKLAHPALIAALAKEVA